MPGASAKVQEYFEVILNLIKNVRKALENFSSVQPAAVCWGNAKYTEVRLVVKVLLFHEQTTSF